jgi:ABC-type branched-subunit amino acid transport system substrate-binding protein
VPEPDSSRAYIYAGIAIGVLVVVVIGAGVIRALGGKGAEQAQKGEGAASQTPLPLTLPAAAPGAGITDTEIVFGMASPFSGANKELGRGMKAGLELAFAAANEAGGIHGRKLSLIALDDEYEPSKTAAVMKELVQTRNVFAIVGNVGSPTAAVSVPYVNEKRIPFIGALSGAPVLRRDPPDRYVFNYQPSYTEETAAAVRYLVNVRRYLPSQIAVFAQQDDFGEACWQGAVAQLRRFKHDPQQVLKTGYKRNSADVEEAVASITADTGELQAVVMGATYRAAARFIVKVRDAGLKVTFTNVSPVDADQLAEELLGAGKGYTEDVVVTQIVPPPTSNATAVVKYRQLLQKYMLGEKPEWLSLQSYIIGNILIEGLRRAGRNVNAESLVDALESIKGLDLGIGVPITFGPSEHQGSHKVWGTMLQPDGTYKLIDLE